MLLQIGSTPANFIKLASTNDAAATGKFILASGRFLLYTCWSEVKLTKITQEMLSSVEGMSSRAAAAELGVSKTAINDARARSGSDNDDLSDANGAQGGYLYEQGTDGSVSAHLEPSEAPLSPENAVQVLVDHGLDPEAYNVSWGFSEWMQGDRKLHSMRVKATPKPKKELGGPRLDADELIRAIENYEHIPSGSETGTETTSDSTFVLCPSDLQFGKTDYNGGSAETLARARTSLERAVGIVKANGYSNVVIAELGDVVENFYNTSGQRESNDLDITGQIRVARRFLLECIMALAPHTDNLIYVSVPSNHGQVRVSTGDRGGASNAANDWGLEIGYQLEDALVARPGYNHVTFVRPTGLHESVSLLVSDTELGFVHGHQSKGADKIGEWWKGQSHGRMPVGSAHILFTGHWHSFMVRHSGDARWIMVAPSSDPGSAWFTELTGEQALSGMLSCVVKDGMWSDLRIL